MPPRFAFWTILIDSKPTAFRARERDELLPTFHQLRRTNPDIVMKWFSGGRLWDSPEAARLARDARRRPIEKRTRDWRPGGAHEDPRNRFSKKPGAKSRWPAKPQRGGAKPTTGRPAGPPRADRAFRPDRSKPRRRG